MRKWKFAGRCGEHGCITEHSNGYATLEVTAGNIKVSKKYLTFTGARLALGNLSKSYTLKEVAA